MYEVTIYPSEFRFEGYKTPCVFNFENFSGMCLFLKTVFIDGRDIKVEIEYFEEGE